MLRLFLEIYRDNKSVYLSDKAEMSVLPIEFVTGVRHASFSRGKENGGVGMSDCSMSMKLNIPQEGLM